MKNTRLVMYHKQSTSARTRFLGLSYGGVCAFDGLPALARIVDDQAADEGAVSATTPHPALLIGEAERQLGLDPGGLEPDAGFRVLVDVPDGPLEVFLAHFTATDPPFEIAERNGARFLDITQARGMAPTELEVLRRAYEWILG